MAMPKFESVAEYDAHCSVEDALRWVWSALSQHNW